MHDPSNIDPAFRRNRVRHELLPLLDAIAERDVTAVLVRQAALLADDADLLASLAATIDVTDARTLAAQPLALARVAVRTWLRGPGVDRRPTPPLWPGCSPWPAERRRPPMSGRVGG